MAWKAPSSVPWRRQACRFTSSPPRQVRECARATGRLAKTDALDAQILAQFGEVLRPTPRPLPDEATQALSADRARRRQLLERLIAEKQRHSQAAARLKSGIATHVAWLSAELQRVDRPGGSHSPEPGGARAG